MSNPFEPSSADKVRPMTQADLRLVFEWRNHPDVRAFMFTSRELAWDEHVAWFARCQAEAGRRLMIFETGNGPAGFVNLLETRAGGIADWGFFVAPGAPRGTGARLGAAALSHAFRECGLHKVCGQAIGSNSRSIAFHKRLGFRQEGVLRDQFFDGSVYIDVVQFGLLAPEYLSAEVEDGPV